MRAIPWLMLLAAAALGADDPAVLSLRQDRLTFLSRGTPAREFLRVFHDAGVRVRLDPALAALPLAGEAVDEPLEAVLDRFDEADYTAVWSRVEGPVGPVDRLAELHLFRRGRPDAARPVFDDMALDVAQDGDRRFVRGELLVGFRPGVTRAQAEAAMRAVGGNLVGSVPGIGAYRVRVPPGVPLPELIALLERHDAIAAVEPNFVVGLPLPVRAGSAGIGAMPEVGISGDGTALLAILDSGVQPLDSLAPWISGRWNTLDPEGDPGDAQGHGTQMALIATGLVTPEGGVHAGGELRHILSIKSFNEQGWTTSWAVMEAVRLAVEQDAKVMNLSWGSDVDSVFLRSAIDRAARDGLILVAAAGNEPNGHPVYPAAWPGVLAVGASNPDGTPSAISNHGAFVDLSAPASATLPIGYQGTPGAYAGTSIASAYTAGVLAQFLAQHPQTSPQDAILLLLQSLTLHIAPESAQGYGAGLLDEDAVRRFLATPPR